MGICCSTGEDASRDSMVEPPQTVNLARLGEGMKEEVVVSDPKLASDVEGRPEWLKKQNDTACFCVKAVHPRSGEFLRARILKDGSEKAVAQIQDIKAKFDKVELSLRTLIEDPDTKAAISLGMPAISLKWGRFYWHEKREAIAFKQRVYMPSSLPINKYLNFIQTVGAPGILYAVDELVDCKDPHSGTWRPGRVAAREQYYYLIRFEGAGSIPPEYVPRNSIRLRPTPKIKESKYQRMEKVWASFKPRQWLQAWNTDVERYVPAQVFEVETFAMTIQFPDDPTLNEIRKLLPPGRRPIEAIIVRYKDGEEVNSQKIKDWADIDKRRRYNKRTIYAKNLAYVAQTNPLAGVPGAPPVPLAANDPKRKTTKYVIHHIDDDDEGRSMYKALSHQLFGTPDNYQYIQKRCLEYIQHHANYFHQFVDIPFEYYIAEKRQGLNSDYYTRADHLDLQAVAEMFDVVIKAYSELDSHLLFPLLFYDDLTERLPVIVLSYAGKEHWDSLVNPADPPPLKLKTSGGAVVATSAPAGGGAMGQPSAAGLGGGSGVRTQGSGASAAVMSMGSASAHHSDRQLVAVRTEHEKLVYKKRLEQMNFVLGAATLLSERSKIPVAESVRVMDIPPRRFVSLTTWSGVVEFKSGREIQLFCELLKTAEYAANEVDLLQLGFSLTPPFTKMWVWPHESHTLTIKYPYIPTDTTILSKDEVNHPTMLLEGPRELVLKLVEFVHGAAIQRTLTLCEQVACAQLTYDEKTTAKIKG